MATRTYYELLEMMQAEVKLPLKAPHQCPVCRFLQAGIRRVLQQLSYENVNDFETRQDLRQAGGFCNRHAHEWLSLNDALGTAIIYEDMLRDAGRRIEKGDFEPRRGSKIFGWRSTGQDQEIYRLCPVCKQEEQIEERVVSEFAEGFNNQENFRAAYAPPETAGVCLPHFREIMGSLNGEQRGVFSGLQREKLARTQAQLHEIIEKLDAANNRTPEQRIIGEEREALSRAIWQMVGL